MNNRTGFLLKNVGVLTLSNFASKILVFLLVPLYTSVLSASHYGIYDIVISTISMVYPILTMNIVDAIMRFGMDKTCDKTAVVTIGVKYILRSILIVGATAMLAHIADISMPLKGLEWYVLIYYTFYVTYQALIQLAKGLENVTAIAVASALGTVITLSANITFLLIIPLGLTGFFVANILAQLVPTIYLVFKTRVWNYITTQSTDKGLEKEMLAYCVPLIVTVLGWRINSSADKYVVVFLCGMAANGVLSVAYKIPSIINILQGIFIQAWHISAIKEFGKSDTAQFYGRTFNVINTLMCAACAWLIFLSKPLAGFLYAKDFYQAWTYVPFLLISSVMNCASGFLGPVLTAKKDVRSMAVSAIYGSLANVVLNIVLVLLIGVQGATIATTISSFVIFLVRKHCVGEDIDIDKYSAILMTWSMLCIQAMIEIYTPFWYIELVLMLLMLTLNRKNIYDILRIIRHL